MLGKVEGRWKRWYREWVDDSIDSMDTSLSKLRKITNAREAWCAIAYGLERVGYNLVTEQWQQTHTGK